MWYYPDIKTIQLWFRKKLQTLISHELKRKILKKNIFKLNPEISKKIATS